MPGAFVLCDVLTSDECERLVQAAEAIKFTPDVVEGIDNITLISDQLFLDSLFQRCKPFLPQDVAGCDLAGINSRFRFFRYYKGAVYRPHIDGGR